MALKLFLCYNIIKQNNDKGGYMKKFLILIISVICLLCAFGLFACNQEHVCEWGSQIYYDQTCHYQKCVNSGCSQINVVKEHDWQAIMQDGTRHYYKCADSACGKTTGLEQHVHELRVDDTVSPIQATKICECGHWYELDYTTVTPETAQRTLNNLYDGSVVALTIGNYGSLRIDNKNDVIITGGNYINVDQIIIEGNCKNIYIYNVSFDNVVYPDRIDGGINLNGYGSLAVTDNLVIKNCKFKNSTGILTDTSYATQNVKIIDCQFNDIYRCSWNGYRKAICLWRYNNLLIEGCTIDGTYGDAIAVGNYGGSGELIIQNNTFKGVTGRTLNLRVGDAIVSVSISSNVFYKELCSMNEDPYLAKDEGVYIYCNRQINVGENVWEELPPNTSLYFYKVNIDMDAQTLLGE